MKGVEAERVGSDKRERTSEMWMWIGDGPKEPDTTRHVTNTAARDLF